MAPCFNLEGVVVDFLPGRRRTHRRHAHVLHVGIFVAQEGNVVSCNQTEKSSKPLRLWRPIVWATGFRPDLSLTRELQMDLDPAVEAPSALAPLIEPNVHSCGSVPPHGAEQLKHPETDFYTVGMKSYGRAPTFLLLTGYEQVRSVVAAGQKTCCSTVEQEMSARPPRSPGHACQSAEQCGAGRYDNGRVSRRLWRVAGGCAG